MEAIYTDMLFGTLTITLIVKKFGADTIKRVIKRITMMFQFGK